MNFKLINATLEVEKTSEGKEKADYDYEKIMVHHLDNNSRYSKDSYLEGFYKKAKIVDDIAKKDKNSAEVKKDEVKPENKSETDVLPKESGEK